jgi:type IV pilus assembly protein PilV
MDGDFGMVKLLSPVKINEVKGLKNGFTLIEIIVSLVILSIAFVGISGQILTTRRGAQATFDEMKGIAYAADMIDRIKTTPYSDIPALNASEDDDSFAKLKISDEEMARTEKPYVRVVTIKEEKQEFNKKDNFKIKKVSVEVKWTVSNPDDKGKMITRPVSVKLDTLVRKLVNY